MCKLPRYKGKKQGRASCASHRLACTLISRLLQEGELVASLSRADNIHQMLWRRRGGGLLWGMLWDHVHPTEHLHLCMMERCTGGMWASHYPAVSSGRRCFENDTFFRCPRVARPSFTHGKDTGTRRTSNRRVRNRERGFFFLHDFQSTACPSLFHVAFIPSVSCVQGNLLLAHERHFFRNVIKFVIVAG